MTKKISPTGLTTNEEMRRQIFALRRALGFYALEYNWTLTASGQLRIFRHVIPEYQTPIDVDRGSVARKALGFPLRRKSERRKS